MFNPSLQRGNTRLYAVVQRELLTGARRMRVAGALFREPGADDSVNQPLMLIFCRRGRLWSTAQVVSGVNCSPVVSVCKQRCIRPMV